MRQRSSLFTYARGKTTNSYTIRGSLALTGWTEMADPALVAGPGGGLSLLAAAGRGGTNHRDPRLRAPLPGGRVRDGWAPVGVTWVTTDGNRLLAKLGDPRGAGGTPQVIPPAPGHDTPDQTAVLASGERLVLATEWSTLAADVNSAWAAVVDPR